MGHLSDMINHVLFATVLTVATSGCRDRLAVPLTMSAELRSTSFDTRSAFYPSRDWVGYVLTRIPQSASCLGKYGRGAHPRSYFRTLPGVKVVLATMRRSEHPAENLDAWRG